MANDADEASEVPDDDVRGLSGTVGGSPLEIRARCRDVPMPRAPMPGAAPVAVPMLAPPPRRRALYFGVSRLPRLGCKGQIVKYWPR